MARRIRRLEIEEAAAEEEVGGRAESRGGTRLRESLAVGVVEVDAMRVHRAFAQQPVAIVDVEVAARTGEETPGPLHFLAVPRHVRLDERGRVTLRERTRQRE